jgi:hypothetical protein
MIVGDFDVPRCAIVPHKAEPPLIVDADTVLTLTISAQDFQAVARRHAQIVELTRGIQQQKLRAKAALNLRRKPAHRMACKDRSRALVREAFDHAIKRTVTRYALSMPAGGAG